MREATARLEIDMHNVRRTAKQSASLAAAGHSFAVRVEAALQGLLASLQGTKPASARQQLIALHEEVFDVAHGRGLPAVHTASSASVRSKANAAKALAKKLQRQHEGVLTAASSAAAAAAAGAGAAGNDASFSAANSGSSSSSKQLPSTTTSGGTTSRQRASSSDGLGLLDGDADGALGSGDDDGGGGGGGNNNNHADGSEPGLSLAGLRAAAAKAALEAVPPREPVTQPMDAESRRDLQAAIVASEQLKATRRAEAQRTLKLQQ